MKRHIVESALVLVLLGSWAFLRVLDLSFPLLDVAESNFHEAVTSSDVCPFLLEPEFDGFKYDELFVEGTTGFNFFWSDKLREAFLQMGSVTGVHDFLQGQLSLYHLYEEVVLSDKFWVTCCCVSVVNLLVLFSVIESSLNKKTGVTDNLTILEKEAWHASLRRFVIGRFIVVGYVIVRSQASIHREKLHAHQPYHNIQRRLADSTIFAIWYCILWSITSITSFTLRRFGWLLTLNQQQISRSASKKLGLILLACFGASAAGMCIACLAVKIIHPIYAAIMLFEITSVFLKSFYGFILVTYFLHQDGGLDSPYIMKFRIYINNMSCFIGALTYAMFITVGTLLNGKLLPLVFVPIFSRYTSHLANVIFGISGYGQAVTGIVE